MPERRTRSSQTVATGVTITMPRVSMPYIGAWSTGNTSPMANNSTTEIHFLLCSVINPGIYKYKGIVFPGGGTELSGTNQSVKVWLVKAAPGTGNPTTVANTTAHECTFGTDVAKKNAFPYAGPDAVLDLRDSPYYWVALQIPSGGFSGGTIHIAMGTSALIAHSVRAYDFYVTRTGVALSYASGLPIVNGAVDTTNFVYTDHRTQYDTDQSQGRLCDWNVEVALEFVKS